MEIDSVLFWENLFLYFYKNQFTSEFISNNKIKAQHFHSTKTPCSSAPARCAPVVSPVDNYAESASPVPNYASRTNK